MRHALPLAVVCAVLLATPSFAADAMAAARLAYEQRADGAQAKAAWELFRQAAKDDPQSRFINERAHANIQRDGTYSVVPRMWGGLGDCWMPIWRY